MKARIAETEKDRYGWGFERESLQETITRLEDEKEKLSKQVSKLNQDKERLKNSKPSSKAPTSYIGSLKTTIEPTKIERTVVQDYNKENTSFQ
jgi:predicted FMN-binding regulatory protein PaiB